MNSDLVTRIYLGKDRHCRCGCGGEYVERGEPGFDRRLKRFNKMLCDSINQGNIEFMGDYTNISYGNNRAMTVYFD